MSYLDRIDDCNRHDPAMSVPFKVGERTVGRIYHDFVDTLSAWGKVFERRDSEVVLVERLVEPGASMAERSAAVGDVFLALYERGLVEGWRDEIHKVARRWTDAPDLLVERAAVPYLGVGGFAVHMNGHVLRPDGHFLWVARRSRSKPTAPGKLDHLVAGGQPAGLGLLDNLVKECAEEAGIPETLAREAKPTGCVSYQFDSARGYRPDTVFTFDLRLPDDFVPVNTDGEVESFELWPMERVKHVVSETREFKHNCSLVIIDFLIRQGHIDAEHPDYVDLVHRLRYTHWR